MARKINITTEAYFSLQNILEYVKNKFSVKRAMKLSEKIDSTLNIISEMPLLYPSTFKFPNIRRCLIDKLTTIYYTFDDRNINVLLFFDNRQNPDKLKSFIH